MQLVKHQSEPDPSVSRRFVNRDEHIAEAARVGLAGKRIYTELEPSVPGERHLEGRRSVPPAVNCMMMLWRCSSSWSRPTSAGGRVTASGRYAL